MTKLSLLGKGLNALGKESHVCRPIKTVWPVVIFLKWAKSSGKCQGSLLSSPMTPSLAHAKIKCMSGASMSMVAELNSHGSFDGRMAIVIEHFKVFKRVIKNGARSALDVQLGVGKRRSRELELNLFKVIGVDVAVPACPNELSNAQVTLLSHHVG
jgi:hypothetical protein